MLRFAGSEQFRQRVIFSVLSGKAIGITDVRSEDELPGLRDFEASLLRLVTKITNGTVVEINETGTTVALRPGIITGGDSISHDCPNSRAVGYYLEALLCMAPFGKAPLEIVLRGITNDNVDPSVDALRGGWLPMLKFFGIKESGLSLKVLKRGARPDGGGEVVFTCPVASVLSPIQFFNPGKVKRVRGIAYATRVSPHLANRMVDAARLLLREYIGDVYIHTDHYRGEQAGRSPGFGLTLVAESTTGVLYCGEWMASEEFRVPEEVGERAGRLLLHEVLQGSCVDTTAQYLPLLFMALGPEDVSRLRIGRLSSFTHSFLDHLRDFFGVEFKIRAEVEASEDMDEEHETLVASCLGSGYVNVARRAQ